MLNKTKISLIIGTALLLIGCIKDDNFDVVPLIEFQGFEVFKSSENAIDSAKFEFTFQDGDGDLGNQEGDTENNIIWIDSITQAVTDSGAPGATIAYGNIFITDSRSGLTFYREMDDIFAGTNNAISGEIQLRMNQYFCSAFASDQDTIIYTVFIKDRANHVSNMITLDTLFLQCQ